MWRDIEHIKEDFSFDKDMADVEVKIALRKLLARNHPDKTGGIFSRPKQKETFEKAQSASDFLKRNERDNAVAVSNRALVAAIEKQNELLVQVLEKSRKEATEASNSQKLISLTDTARKVIKKDTASARRPTTISGISVAAISAFLLAFRGPIEDFLKALPITDNTSARLMVLGGILYIGLIAATLAFISHRREQREIEQRERLLTEDGFRRFLFSKPLASVIDYAEDNGEDCRILSLNKMAEALREYSHIENPSIIQALAEALFQRLLDRHLAEPMSSPFLSPTLKLLDPVVDEILYSSHKDESF